MPPDPRPGTNDAERVRTYAWEDPAEAAAGAPGRSGIEFLRAIADGVLPPPPIARTLDLALVEVDEGRAVFAFEPREFHYNPIGAPCTEASP